MRNALVAFSCIAACALLAPPALSQAPTMDSLWPNDDGRSWSYDLHYELFGADPMVVDDQIRIFFDGTTVAPDGIQAQYLRQELIGGTSPLIALAATVPDPLLRQLWVARPSLRDKIVRAAADYPCPENAPNSIYAILLNGEFAYRKTADEIAAWRCNLANTRSWQWLVSDLTIGNTFTLQLLPDVANDIFLHGTIAAIEPVSVPAGIFNDCVRVDYVIDYGTDTCRDENGDPLGTLHWETRGHVHYAPETGPIESDEAFVLVAATGTCTAPVDVGSTEATTSLRLNAPAVPVRSRSWGRLKALYR